MNPVAVICIAMPIVAAFFWLSGFCFGRARGSRDARVVLAKDDPLLRGLPVRVEFDQRVAEVDDILFSGLMIPLSAVEAATTYTRAKATEE